MSEPIAAPAPPSSARAAGGKTIVRAIFEVGLIALGVFLGLAGEQWRDRAERREHTIAALERFRTEILANQKSVAAVKPYHVEARQKLRVYFGLAPDERRKAGVRLAGVQPAFFEHTAWDLAIATQSLADIDRDLAYALTRIYGAQQTYQDLTRGMLQAMYLRPVTENPEAFLGAVDTFYGDVVLIEPELERMYEAALPLIDRSLAR